MNFESRLKKKEQMLERCFELFVKQGLENTSLNDLASCCETHKSSMYIYFESKDEIILESTKMFMSRLNEFLENEFNSPRSDICDVFERCFECVKSNANRMRFVYQVLSSPKYGAESRLFLEEICLDFYGCLNSLADMYKIDHQKLKPLFMIFTSVIHDYCLWGNSLLANEKLNYIYSKVSEPEKGRSLTAVQILSD